MSAAAFLALWEAYMGMIRAGFYKDSWSLFDNRRPLGSFIIGIWDVFGF